VVSKAFWARIYEVEMGVHRRAGMRSQHMRQRSDRLDKTMAKRCCTENIMNGKSRRDTMVACRSLQ
jgi:hypothetical protein